MVAIAGGRQTEFQQIHYLRRTFNYNDSDKALAYVGTLPAGAVVLRGACRIETGFNAGSSNPITVGTNSSTYDNIMPSAAITSATPALYEGTAAQSTLVPPTADTDVYATYIPTGGAATAGKAHIVIPYIPNNDR